MLMLNSAEQFLAQSLHIQFGMLMLNSAEQFLAQSQKVAKTCQYLHNVSLSAFNNLRITEWFYEI
jgi:hypothetical protein